eukprot:28164-Prymnesium_polylepis.1
MRAVLIRPVLHTPPSVAAASAATDALRRLQRFEAPADCCKRGAQMPSVFRGISSCVLLYLPL